MSNKFLTFFEKAFSWIKKFFSNGNWAHAALSTLEVTAPLIEDVLLLVDPAIEPAAAAILTKIETGFATAATLLTEISHTPTTSTIAQVKVVLAAIKSNVSSIEASLQIKNPATLAKVTAAVDTLSAEIDAILNQIPVSATA